MIGRSKLRRQRGDTYLAARCLLFGMREHFVYRTRSLCRDVTLPAIVANVGRNIFNHDHAWAVAEGLVFQVKARGLLPAERTNLRGLLAAVFLFHSFR